MMLLEVQRYCDGPGPPTVGNYSALSVLHWAMKQYIARGILFVEGLTTLFLHTVDFLRTLLSACAYVHMRIASVLRRHHNRRVVGHNNDAYTNVLLAPQFAWRPVAVGRFGSARTALGWNEEGNGKLGGTARSGRRRSQETGETG